MLPTKMTQMDNMQAVLRDTIVLLCQNGLRFQSQFNIEALLAITVDQNEVLLVSIKETVHANDTDVQASDLVTADEDKLPTDITAIKPEFTSAVAACASVETDVATGHAQENKNSSDILSGLTVRLTDVDKDSHAPLKTTSSFDQSPNTELSENCTSDKSISRSHSPSAEALDLTRSARTQAHTTIKRKLVSSSVVASKEVRLDEPQAPANDIDDCSESSSIVCVKDEILTSDDIDTDWSASHLMSIPWQGNCQNNRSCYKDSSLLDDANNGSSVTEEVTNASLSLSDQATSEVDLDSVCCTIIAYSGWCVPLRDVQRLRLRGLPSAVIRAAMETLERSGLGRCCEVTGNMCVFYKCPPHLVTGDALSRWRITWNDYSLYFATLPALNQTNRHNESYWQRVASSSPYSYA